MRKRIFALIISALLIASASSCANVAQEIKFSHFTGNFSPFFAQRATDLSVTDMVHEPLIVKTDKEGQITPDAYTKGLGIADISVEYEGADLVYTIELGRDIYFSDGTQMTVDDIIFSMYVYADPSYTGWSNFNRTKIKGLKNYRMNNQNAEGVEITTEQIDDIMARMPDELKTEINQKLIKPLLVAEYDWVCDVYDNKDYIGTEVGEYAKQYPVPKDLFAFLYAIDMNYDSTKVDDPYAVIDDVSGQYGYDYKTLAAVLDVDLEQYARRYAEETALAEILKDYVGPDVLCISGIKKVDDFKMTVTLYPDEFENVENTLGIYVAPLHYYGDKQAFDIENNNFGFTRGALESVHGKDGAPLGAGQYVFENYDPGAKVTFSANAKYFRNIKPEEKIVFEATGNSNEDKTHKYYVRNVSDILYKETQLSTNDGR